MNARLRRAAQLIAEGESEHDALIGAGFSEITASNWPGVTQSLIHWGLLGSSAPVPEAPSAPVDEPADDPTPLGRRGRRYQRLQEPIEALPEEPIEEPEPDEALTETKRARGRPRKGA